MMTLDPPYYSQELVTDSTIPCEVRQGHLHTSQESSSTGFSLGAKTKPTKLHWLVNQPLLEAPALKTGHSREVQDTLNSKAFLTLGNVES